MAWTTPRTWATNDSLSASTLNIHLRDNLSFLYGAPRCRVHNSAAQTLTTATFTAITMNSERFDNDSLHSTVTNTARITFATAGVYLVGGALEFVANSTGVRGAFLRINGTTYISGGIHMTRTDGGGAGEFTATIYSFAVSDYVELMGYQNSGGNLDTVVDVNQAPEFWAVFQGN